MVPSESMVGDGSSIWRIEPRITVVGIEEIPTLVAGGGIVRFCGEGTTVKVSYADVVR
jgi:hypothetical protein